MTPEELKEAIINLVDEHGSNMSKEEYSGMLRDLADDFNIRAEATEQEMEDEDNSGDGEDDDLPF